jgi:hypothetical protein
LDPPAPITFMRLCVVMACMVTASRGVKSGINAAWS